MTVAAPQLPATFLCQSSEAALSRTRHTCRRRGTRACRARRPAKGLHPARHAMRSANAPDKAGRIVGHSLVADFRNVIASVYSWFWKTCCTTTVSIPRLCMPSICCCQSCSDSLRRSAFSTCFFVAPVNQPIQAPSMCAWRAFQTGELPGLLAAGGPLPACNNKNHMVFSGQSRRGTPGIDSTARVGRNRDLFRTDSIGFGLMIEINAHGVLLCSGGVILNGFRECQCRSWSVMGEGGISSSRTLMAAQVPRELRWRE